MIRYFKRTLSYLAIICAIFASCSTRKQKELDSKYFDDAIQMLKNTLVHEKIDKNKITINKARMNKHSQYYVDFVNDFLDEYDHELSIATIGSLTNETRYEAICILLVYENNFYYYTYNSLASKIAFNKVLFDYEYDYDVSTISIRPISFEIENHKAFDNVKMQEFIINHKYYGKPAYSITKIAASKVKKALED